MPYLKNVIDGCQGDTCRSSNNRNSLNINQPQTPAELVYPNPAITFPQNRLAHPQFLIHSLRHKVNSPWHERMSAGNRFLFALILLSIVLIIYAFLGTYAAMTDQQYDPFLVALGFLVLSLWISFILVYQRARRKKAQNSQLSSQSILKKRSCVLGRQLLSIN